ncbi:MAG TPA: PAS domain-containing protein, partial [Anaerolineales bacterium]
VHQIELEMQNDELRRVQHEIESSRDRFSLLYDLAPVGYVTLDAEGGVHEANLTTAALLNVDRRDLVGNKLTRFVTPEAQDTFYLYWQKVFTTGAKEICELSMRRPNGANFIAELESIATPKESGDPRHCLVALRDITERSVVEGLRRSERTLAAFFDQAPIVLLWVGASGLIQRINQSGLDLLGRSREVLLSQPVTTFFTEPALAADLLKRLDEKETVQNYQARLLGKNGFAKWVLIDANGFWDKGQMVHSRWFVRDVTYRIELEKQILTIAEQEQRRIGQDLHDDLCQQLTGIEYFSQALARKLEIKSKAEAAQAKQIAHLVLQATICTRELAHGLHPVSLEAEGLMDALQTLAIRTQKLCGILCHFQCQRPALIHDHEMGTHLYRIAQEAVSNAIRHGKTTRIDIDLATKGDTIVLAVRDNGVGIPKKLPLHKGVGLHVMQYRVGVLGGSLVVQRQPTGGTAVVCTVNNGKRKSP